MMQALAISALLQLLTASIDALRIRMRWAATPNIDHGISTAIGTAAAVGQWFIQQPAWSWWTFALLSVGMRLALFDPLENLLRRERLDYNSTRTSARTAAWWRRLGISFWGQRAVGAGLVLVSSLLQFFIYGR